MKQAKRLLALLLSAMLLVSMTVVAQAEDATAGVAIDETNFPDAVFRQYILDKFDTDGYGSLSDAEMEKVTSINVHSEDITDLTGMEYFKEKLVRLSISNTQISGLVLENYPKLKELSATNDSPSALNDSRFTELTIRNCPSLGEVYLYRGKLRKLSISGCEKLYYLECSDNALSELNITDCAELILLRCENNQLTEFDGSGNACIIEMYCPNNQLTSLVMPENVSYIKCPDNPIKALDVGRYAELRELNCSNCQLTSLDLTGTYVGKEESFFECENNVAEINVYSDRKFDLATLPGSFDVTRASNWDGGTVSGTTLTVNADAEAVTYDYDCGNDQTATFTLMVKQLPDPTPVPTATPTPVPTATPTPTPTAAPTATPTAAPTAAPTATPKPPMTETTVTETITVTEKLKEAGIATEEQVKENLADRVAENEGYEKENAFVAEVELKISEDNGTTWRPVTAQDFADNGTMDVVIPYPAGTSAETQDFIVYHMFAETANGHQAGEIEQCPVRATEDGLVVTVSGLSPVMVAWKTKTAAPTPAPTAAPTQAPTGQPQTGDNGVSVLWFVMAGVSALALLLLVSRRHKGRHVR